MTASFQHNILYGPIKYGPIKKDQLGACMVIDPMPGETEDLEAASPTGLAQADLPQPFKVLVTGGRPPSAGVVVTTVARRLIEMAKAGEKVDTLALMGNVDPTTHPNFKQIVENLRELRNKWFSKAKLAIFVTPLNLSDPETRHVVSTFDKPVMRMEWGTAKVFESMTGAPSTQLKEVMANLGNLDRMIVQATFRKGPPDNSADSEVKGWLKRVEELRPLEVQISTVENSRKKGAPKPVTASFLEKLGEQIREKTDVPVQTREKDIQCA